MTRELLEYVTPWLVDNPDEITIDEVEGERDTVVYEVSVHPDDVGKMIGKRGRIIRSLRVLARVAGQQQGQRVMVEVVD
jgi:predicted RNA-binding protein YlqC (UPF0109 family)